MSTAAEKLKNEAQVFNCANSDANCVKTRGMINQVGNGAASLMWKMAGLPFVLYSVPIYY